MKNYIVEVKYVTLTSVNIEAINEQVAIVEVKQFKGEAVERRYGEIEIIDISCLGD